MSDSGAPAPRRPVVVIGAGVSGLTVAYRLERAGVPVLCLEASPEPGGNIRTARHDGYVYDLGPDSFLKTKPEGAALCADLGLSDELIVPRPRGALVYVARDGALYPMPEGLSLGVPKRPGPFLATSLLSGPAKFRALLEPFVRRPKHVGEESIHDFLSRRLGAEMAERLAAPLLAGVFAGDAERLSMDAAFPQLIELEKRHGSLFRGMNGGRSILSVMLDAPGAPESPFLSLRGGLGALIEALTRALRPGTLRLRTAARALQPLGDGARVHTDEGTIDAASVVLAGPPWAAAPLLGPLDAALGRALDGIRGFQTATVFFAFDETKAQHDFVGSGFIVPPGEAEILAATFVSSKWDGRAPKGKVLVRAFVGGSRQDISPLSDRELEALAHKELTRFLGPLGPIEFARVHRYARGTPQPELGYPARLGQIERSLGQLPWLSVLGSGYGGVGIPDCIKQANEVAAGLARPTA